LRRYVKQKLFYRCPAWNAISQLTVTENRAILARTIDMSGYDAVLFNTRRENLPDFGNLTLSRIETWVGN
jgi:hypothetical protein